MSGSVKIAATTITQNVLFAYNPHTSHEKTLPFFFLTTIYRYIEFNAIDRITSKFFLPNFEFSHFNYCLINEIVYSPQIKILFNNENFRHLKSTYLDCMAFCFVLDQVNKRTNAQLTFCKFSIVFHTRARKSSVSFYQLFLHFLTIL